MGPKVREKADGTGAKPPRPSFMTWLRTLFVGTEGNEIVRQTRVVPFRELFRFFVPFVRPYLKYVGFLGVLIVLVPLAQGARLFMVKVTVDNVLIPQDTDPLRWIIPVILGITIVGGVLAYFHSYVSTWVGQRFILDLRARLFAHLQTLSLDFFERQRLGDLLSRVMNDISQIEQFVLSGVADSLGAIVRVVFFAGALFWIDWRLALVSFVVAPAFALMVRVVSRLIKRASREKRRRTGALTAIAEESLSNVALVQAYNRQKFEVRRFRRENWAAFEATMIGTRVKSLMPPMIDLVQVVAGLAVLSFGTSAIGVGRMTVGELILFVAYLNQLYSPMKLLANLYNTIYSASAGAERVLEVMEEKPSIVDREDAVKVERMEGLVEVDGIKFTYPGTSRVALDDVSFTVRPGQTLALVGHSGAGKTTLAKLLLRFYDPDEGEMRLDGTALPDLRLHAVRDNVAVLLQETLVFEGTIAENIRYGKPDATDEEIVAAAEQAAAHEFIRELPEGYDTMVGQKGRRLSGGERQRVAIARAMIRNAPILILDEPTTGLDAESGHRIMEPLRRLMRGRTTIVISHNLMTVRDADEIVVLDHGRVVERGTHGDLLERDGPYAQLCRLSEAASYLQVDIEG